MFRFILVLFVSLFSLSAHADVVLFEAEKHTQITAPVQISADESASALTCIEIQQGAGVTKGSVQYTFQIQKKAVYYIWMRVWWLDSCGNSITVEIDSNKGKLKPFTLGQDGTYKKWHWVKAKVRLALSEGEHTLLLTNREDGIKIDQILLSSDRRVVPVGIE